MKRLWWPGIAIVAAALLFLGLPRVWRSWFRPAARPQAVRWSPGDPRGPGMCLDDCLERLPWAVVKEELESRVLPGLPEIPAGSAAKLIDDQGRRDWVVVVVAPEGGTVANVWLGTNPTRGWVTDGLVRIGTPMAPVGIFGTFQRLSDGNYRRVEEPGRR